MQIATIFREGPDIAKFDDGSEQKGHYYTIAKQWNEFDEADENPINSWIDRETWVIYPDGVFEYHHIKNKEETEEVCPGLYDRTRYDAFVEMMKNFKTEWMAELEYDEENRKVYPLEPDDEIDG